MPQTGAPLGTSPLGLGIQEEQPKPPTSLDMSRFINISTGKYELRRTSTLYANMPSVRQRVVIIARTLNWPRKIGKTFEVETRQQIADAMEQMTKVEKVATLDDVIVERSADGVRGRTRVTISFTDLQTGRSDVVHHDPY